MSFVLSKVFGMFAQPSTVVLLICVAGAIIQLWRPRSNWGRRFLLLGVAILAACAFLPLGAWLLRPLEDRFPPPSSMPVKVDGIVLLGGAIEPDVDTYSHMPALNARAARVTAFLILAHRYPHARLVYTGGNADVFGRGTAEADLARAMFSGMGLDPGRIRYERESRNTRENAVLTKKLMKPENGERWLLVTSAADMPRAIGCFRAVGWSVLAYPVDYRGSRQGTGSIPGLRTGLEEVDWAAHEWIGLAYYRVRNWIPTLFPHP